MDNLVFRGLQACPNDAEAIHALYKTLRNGTFKTPTELKAMFPSLDNFKHKDKWWVIDFFNEASYVSHIHNNAEYKMALALMDELIEEYDT